MGKKENLKMDRAVARQGLWVAQQEHQALNEMHK